MRNSETIKFKMLFLGVLVAGMLITSCKDSPVSSADDSELTASTLSSHDTGSVDLVFKSDESVDTWDPILPATEDKSWGTTVCRQDGSIGLNAGWTNPHKAYNIRSQLGGVHPFEVWFPHHDFDAVWINAFNDDHSSGSGGPGGHNWSKYEMPVSGEGEFVVQLLADNCSWIYLDGTLVGYQDDAGLDDPDSGQYGVSLSGDHTLSFIIFDGGGAAGGKFRLETTESFGGTVPPIVVTNTAPVADAGADQTVASTGPNTTVNLDGSASSDADGDELSYSWTYNGAEVSTLATATADLPVGTHTITLTVSDGTETDTDEVVVVVSNSAPVADAGADQVVHATGLITTVTLDGSASSDPDGEELTYSWTYNGTEISTSATATADLPVGTHTFTLTVSDGTETDTDEVVVEVSNTAPEADAGADQEVEATGPNTTVNMDGSASSDADGDELTYSWTYNGTEISTTATATADLSVGTHTFTLTVSDGVDTDTDEVVVEVVDTTVPEMSYEQVTGSLWPPNHKMVLVLTGISASDLVDGATGVNVTVISNESSNGRGDGNTEQDYEIVTYPDGSVDVYLRAERSGKGGGRTYTVAMNATDAEGNTASASVTASVAKSQGKR